MKRELANGCGAIDFGVSTRRVGLCWEATRAPQWTRIPQAWAAQAAQAGFLRDRQECEKSQGVWGTASPKSPSPAHRRLDGRQHAGQNFQTQILLVAQTIGSSLNDPDLVVESLDKAQRHFVLRPAKGGDALPVRFDHAGELLVGFESLPFEGAFPVLEESASPTFPLVTPELSERLLEQVGHVQAPVGSQKLLERATTIQSEILSIGQQGVFLSFDEVAFAARQTGVFAPCALGPEPLPDGA